MARHMAVSESNNYATMPVSYKAHKHEGSSNDSSEHLQQSEKLINDTYYPTITQCTGPIPYTYLQGVSGPETLERRLNPALCVLQIYFRISL